jgi:hypothetical protein
MVQNLITEHLLDSPLNGRPSTRGHLLMSLHLVEPKKAGLKFEVLDSVVVDKTIRGLTDFGSHWITSDPLKVVKQNILFGGIWFVGINEFFIAFQALGYFQIFKLKIKISIQISKYQNI